MLNWLGITRKSAIIDLTKWTQFKLITLFITKFWVYVFEI